MTDRPVKLLIACLAVLGLAANINIVLTWDLSLIANDGIQYISTAKNWLAGLGLSTDALIYGPHYQGVIPAAQTVWPPGYPIAIALFSKIGLELPHAALALNVVTHVFAGLLVWIILRKLEVGKTFATMSAFAFYFLGLPWAYVSAAMTEPLFTTLLLAALWLIPDIKRSQLTMWICCGLLIAAGIYVRYSTVLFALGVGAGIFAYILVNDRKPFSKLIMHCSKLALLTLIPLLAFAQLMTRTNNLVGTLDRYSGSKEPESLTSTILLWIAKTSELLGFSSSSLLSGSMAKILFVAFVSAALAIVLIFFLTIRSERQTNNSENSKSYFYVLSLVVYAHTLFLALYLSINSMSTAPLEILTRYIYQVYPGLYVLFCYMLFHVSKKFQTSDGVVGKVVSGITTAMVAVYFLAQINSVFSSRMHFFEEAISASDMMSLPVTSDTTLNDYVVKCFNDTPAGKAIWATHGQPIHLHSGLPTLTHLDIFTRNGFDKSHHQQQVEQYKLGMFFFIDFPGRYSKGYTDYMDDMKSWLQTEGYTKVPMQHSQFSVERTVEVYTADVDCGL